MKNIFLKSSMVLLIGIVMTAALSGCTSETLSDTITVAVSVAPQKAFVEAIVGDRMDVVTLIPPGASPANYQPSPREMTALEKASVYFSIGVPTEEGNILPLVEANYSDVDIVHLADLVEDVYEARYFEDEHVHEDEDHEDEDHEDEDHEDENHEEEDHDHTGRDPHIWLSPKRVVVMVYEMVDVLVDLDPEHADEYKQNADVFINELMGLDQEIKDILGDESLEFIIMHPSLGYFADDYGLEMVAIEEDGKSATSEHLQRVIEYALEHDIHTVFYQTEFDSSQAATISEEINGSVVELNVLSEDYLENLKKMTKALKGETGE